MDALQALVLGIVQGLTEWLPVSSSGHLVIAQKLLGLQSGENLLFDLVVHLGTLVAVCAYFRKELWETVRSVFMRRASVGPRESALRMLAALLVVGTIPTAIAGVLLSDTMDRIFDVRLVGVALVFNGAFLLALARFGSSGQRKAAKAVDAVIIGLFQAVAIIPGISRSGSTIGGGMLRGLERETAAVFAFLLSVPTLVGAFAFGLVGLDRYDTTLVTAAIGFVTALVVGIASIQYLLKAVKAGKIWIFGPYCIALGLAVAVLTL